MKIIDMRVRAPFEPFYNFFYTEEGLKGSAEESMRRLGVSNAESAKQFSMELLLEEAKEANIEKIVVPIRRKAGKNEELIKLLKKYPDKVEGLAGISPENIDESIEEIRKTVVEGPCRGITMEPSLDNVPWYVNDKRIYPVYEYCENHHVPIFMTFGGIMNKSLRHYNPETLDDVAAAFPKLKIGLAHGGWPYVTQVCQIALYRRNVYIAPDFYMIETPGMNDYIVAANTLLSDRIMFGSAYPIMPLKESSEYYLNSGIEKSVLPKVMYENAKEFLDLH